MATISDDKKRVLRLLGNRNVLECLLQISRNEARFKELDVIPNERMRSLRLAEMERLGLVRRKGRESQGKIISVYRITDYGKRILESAQRLVE